MQDQVIKGNYTKIGKLVFDISLGYLECRTREAYLILYVCND